MSPASKIISLFAFSFLIVAAIAEPRDVPGNLFGTYRSTNTVCFVGPQDTKGKIVWQDCSRKTDTLIISRLSKIDAANGLTAKVSLELNFTNAHQCIFDGKAFWSRDRLIALSNEEANCKLAIYFFHGAGHVSASEQCRSQCGERGQIDGAILHR